MHRFRRASSGPAGATKDGSTHAGENSQRSSATTAPATSTAPFTSGNNEVAGEPSVNGSGKRAAPSPPSTTGFFSNRHRSATPTPRVSDGDNVNPFAALKHGSGNADSVPERQLPTPSSSLWRGDADNAPGRQPSAPSSSLWRGDAPSGAVARARGAPPVAAEAEHQPSPPPAASPPCFRFPSSSGKRQQAPLLPAASFGKEHDHPNITNNKTTTTTNNNHTNNFNTDNNSINNHNTNNNTNNSSDHGLSPGGLTSPDAAMETPQPRSAATHQPRGTAAQPRGTAAPRAGVITRENDQQGRARGSTVGEGASNRCAPRDTADLARHNDGGRDSAGKPKGPRLRDERQAPTMPVTSGGRKEARCRTPPPPSLSNDRGTGAEAAAAVAAGAAVAVFPPSSQLDTVMEDHDPFDDLSVAESALFADASARIQKLRRRQLSVREGFARSHFRLLQGDAGFKIHADAEHLVASTSSLLQEMNLEADAAPGDEERSQQIQDQQMHNQKLHTF